LILVILALVLTAQISQEKPSQGDFVILYTDLWSTASFNERIEVWSQPDTAVPPDWEFPAGQMAFVLSAPIRGWDGLSTREVSILLVGGKKYVAETYCLVKVTDIDKAKKIFLDLSEALSNPGLRKIVAAKRRGAIAKKYQISLKDLDIIERAGSTNKWKKGR
jgi:hypothetical protein